jgi:EAL domain-containing protein (putative c-di-GMP-specific phosphodiesterase class I)
LEQLLQLKTIGCEFGQGYWFSKPLDWLSIQQMISAQTQWSLNETLEAKSSLMLR